MGCIELAGLFPRVCGEIADKVFIDEAQNVVIEAVP